MIFIKILLLFIGFPSLYAMPLAEQFKQTGYLEICDKKHETATFDSLYRSFDAFIAFLQTNPRWAQKLYSAKERFIRTKERNFYSTNFFGFYDESKRVGRNQISFYYSTHFHEFMSTHYPEFNEIPEIRHFFEACFTVQQPCGNVFEEAALELEIDSIFSSEYGQPPILLKVIKYFSDYKATNLHYDGTAFSLFLDSTDNKALLLSPYKSSFTKEDFRTPLRECSSSILLIPGSLLIEFSIFPTPHMVDQSGKIRYATIAFAMRPHFIPEKYAFSLLPKY